MDSTEKIRRLNRCVFDLNVHIVLATKYSARYLDGLMLERLNSNVKALANQWNCELLEFNGEFDHVHLLAALSPPVAPSAFISNIKTVTAMMLKRDFPLRYKRYSWGFRGVWSCSYCVISCGGAPLDVLKRYIENQDRPH